MTVTTNGSGDVTFSEYLTASVAAGEFISATATDPSGNTSEFSKVVAATANSILVVDTAADYSNVDANYGNTSSITALLADKGADNLISLREAIDAANNALGSDRIHFSIGSGVQTIAINGAVGVLPKITESVVIDGTSQNGFSGTPLIVVDGNAVVDSGPVSDFGLWITGSHTTIRGLVINQFQEDGIYLQNSDNHLIVGNYIGTDATGTVDLGNTDIGIWIGTSSNNTIGGTTAADRNVIAGNNSGGILVDAGSNSNLIQGNYIGIGSDGNTALGNSGHGIRMRNGTDFNTVGGTASGAGNVISDNNGVGIWIDDGDDNLVQGNLIGTDATGTLDRGNNLPGIRLDNGAQDNTIGGTSAGARNVISGNSDNGVEILDPATQRNLFQGNFVGVDITGENALGNAIRGIHIHHGSDNTIGGTVQGAGNIIAYNGGDGIGLSEVGPNVAIGNVVSGNSIHTNGSGPASGDLGIDLNDDGITSNDGGDGDSGTNRRQNTPNLLNATSDGVVTTIRGNLSTTASVEDYVIEFFANPSASPGREGTAFIGAITVTTDGTGVANFDFPFDPITLHMATANGVEITATATRVSTGDTSEFSNEVTVAGTANTTPTALDDNYTVSSGQTLTVDWWDIDWTKRQQLMFNNLQQTEDLIDFPVLVKLNSLNIDYSQVQDGGQDLRFFDATGTALSYEIEKWNESGDSHVWVKVPQINGSSSQDFIWMYYGNAGAVAAANSSAVWGPDYEAVWHLPDDFLDSTSNNRDGTNGGSTDAQGQIADGQEFDGATDYVDMGSTDELDAGAMDTSRCPPGCEQTSPTDLSTACSGKGESTRSTTTTTIDGTFGFGMTPTPFSTSYRGRMSRLESGRTSRRRGTAPINGSTSTVGWTLPVRRAWAHG